MKTYTYGTLDAGRFGALKPVNEVRQAAPAAFPQTPGSLDWLLGPGLAELEQSEEAFGLSVFAPEGATDLPVMVFLPGGAFVSGAGPARWYDATTFANEQQCVVVIVNYRIGLLAHNGSIGAGNLVPDDLLIALGWVRRNISAHGGDPAEVSLVGQSAGAFWALVLAQLPAAQGLFKRVALMSLTFQPPLDANGAAERQGIIDKELGGSNPEEAAIGQLLAAQGAVARAWAGRGLGLMPGCDEMVPADLFDVDAAIGRLHVDQILLTHTKDEASAFIGQAPEAAFGEKSLTEYLGANFQDPGSAAERLGRELPNSSPKTRLVRAMTMHQIELYATEFADAAAAAGKQVTTARFDVRSGMANAASAHCLELPFLFHNKEQWFDAPMLSGIPAAVYDAASAELGALLGGFVGTGTPCSAAGEPVPAFEPNSESLRVIDSSGTRQLAPERGYTAYRLTGTKP